MKRFQEKILGVKCRFGVILFIYLFFNKAFLTFTYKIEIKKKKKRKRHTHTHTHTYMEQIDEYQAKHTHKNTTAIQLPSILQCHHLFVKTFINFSHFLK